MRQPKEGWVTGRKKFWRWRSRGWGAVGDARLSHVRRADGRVPGSWIERTLIAGLLMVSGCGSPGHPLPPSLGLPEVVKDLRAERVGDAVELRWTTPAMATDGVALRGGGVRVELCREVVMARASGAGSACTVVRQWTEAQGPAVVEDALPAALTVEPAGALVYRVRLLNGAGKSAGLSNAAYAASGRAPDGFAGLEVRSDVAGVRLLWTRSAGPDAAVEMVRTDLSGAVAGQPGTGSVGAARGQGSVGRQVAGRRKGGAAGSAAGEHGVSRLVVVPGLSENGGAENGGADQGGAIDPTASRDREYKYVLTRVRTVHVAGQSLELRGPASAGMVVRVRDLSPPGVPKELVAAADGRVVALSWEPEFAADLAGYRVYRAEMARAPESMPPAAPWRRLNKDLVATPSYQDVVPGGGEFWYRVTAVDSSGNESAAAEAVAVRSLAPGRP